MNGTTRTKQIKLVEEKRGVHAVERPDGSAGAEWIEYGPKKEKASLLLQADRLIRNLAVAGGLLLVVVAVKNAGTPESQSVFSALQASVNAEWDESVGKLSFVGNLFPEGIREVWSQRESISVYAPISGEIVHAWSESEPYIEMRGAVTDVRAAGDGEIMSIAHGLEEERILRIRHEDGTEALYGNLRECFFDVGDWVFAGEIIAQVLQEKPLAFELRKDGRSINPEGLMRDQPE